MDFSARLRELAADPAVTVDAFIDVMYSDANPLLDPPPGGLLPGRGFVTARTLADPGYAEQLALLTSKRTQRGTLDPVAAEAAYTLTPKEAAGRAGVSESAVRAAITAGRLAARRRDGRWYLHPAAVDGYALEARRGPSADLVAVVGGEPGHALNIRSDGRQVKTGASVRVSGWTRAFVRTVDKGDREDDAIRFYELEPGGSDGPIALGGLRVDGRYRIVREIRNSMEALKAWKER